MGKRVSWVELYLDLVFVLAIGQLAHLIVTEPEMPRVWIALGLFVTLWWTWVGFAVLYNRHGADEPLQRVLFLAGSVPAGVAAVAIEPAASGDTTVFALSLAVTRLVLALANAVNRADVRITRACLLSAALFGLSAAVPEPFRYVLWAIAISVESGAMLARADAQEPLDPHHFAERFGLFLIILLGEVVVEAGQAPVDSDGWTAVVAVMLLAAGLWWAYFSSAAEINLKVLELSGGSPAMARTLFAAGHMLPAFALLMTAAGVGLLLEGEPPRIAYWLPCIGVGIYMAGTRVFLLASSRVPGVVRALLLVATFQLGRLEPHVSPRAYLWVLAGWVLMCAALTTRGEVDLTRFLGRGERRVRRAPR